MENIIESRPVYWELNVGEHKKFWAAKIIDNSKNNQNNEKSPQKNYSLIRKWGTIGKNGQTIIQEYDDLYEAELVLERLIRKKEFEGYKSIF